MRVTVDLYELNVVPEEDVRFGSSTAVRNGVLDVGFTPKNGHYVAGRACPFRAKKRHSHAAKMGHRHAGGGAVHSIKSGHRGPHRGEPQALRRYAD